VGALTLRVSAETDFRKPRSLRKTSVGTFTEPDSTSPTRLTEPERTTRSGSRGERAAAPADSVFPAVRTGRPEGRRTRPQSVPPRQRGPTKTGAGPSLRASRHHISASADALICLSPHIAVPCQRQRPAKVRPPTSRRTAQPRRDQALRKSGTAKRRASPYGGGRPLPSRSPAPAESRARRRKKPPGGPSTSTREESVLWTTGLRLLTVRRRMSRPNPTAYHRFQAQP